MGPGDKMCGSVLEYRATKMAYSGDLVIVTEKMDGRNYGVARCGEMIYPTARDGTFLMDGDYDKETKSFVQWIKKNESKFLNLLNDGQVASGEWLERSHGTKYSLNLQDPFVVFDIKNDWYYKEILDVVMLCNQVGLEHPNIVHVGGAIDAETCFARIDEFVEYLAALVSLFPDEMSKNASSGRTVRDLLRTACAAERLGWLMNGARFRSRLNEPTLRLIPVGIDSELLSQTPNRLEVHYIPTKTYASEGDIRNDNCRVLACLISRPSDL